MGVRTGNKYTDENDINSSNLTINEPQKTNFANKKYQVNKDNKLKK